MQFSKLLITAVLIILPAAAPAEELELINRPVNTSGLTGLLFTTSPFTVPARTIETGVAFLVEKSTRPDYDLKEFPSISVTAGLSGNAELALKTSYFHRTAPGGAKTREGGDTELSWKWSFQRQDEASLMPALAVLVTGIAPTSDQDLNTTGGVVHWGARFGLSAGREVIWGDHVIGVFGDAQWAVRDLSDERFRDRYGIVNAGLLFPISKYRNLQMLFEYTLASGIDRISAQGGDYSGLTYGLRLVGEKFNLSFGAQFLRKLVEGFDNSSRIIGMMSIKL